MRRLLRTAAGGAPSGKARPRDPKDWVLHASDAEVAPLGAGAAAA